MEPPYQNNDNETRETFDSNEPPIDMHCDLLIEDNSNKVVSLNNVEKREALIIETSMMSKKLMPPSNPESTMDDNNQASSSSNQAASSSSSSSHEDCICRWLLNDIMTKNKYENVTDMKLILRKKLEASDVTHQQNRLSIPESQSTLSEFLTDAEKLHLNKSKSKNNEINKKESIDVKVIGWKSLKEYNMTLCRWDFEGGVGFRYVLNGSAYKSLRSENELGLRDTIRLVSFRSNGHIYFLVNKLKFPLMSWGRTKPRTPRINYGVVTRSTSTSN